MSGSSLLKLSEVTVQYFVTKKSEQKALDNVSLEIPTIGYTLALIGESGSGKTTLGLSILNLIERPGRVTHGKIEYDGKNILDMSKEQIRRYRGEQVAMIYQSAMNSLSPTKTILGHVEEVIREHTRASKVEARERAIKLLSEVGIRPDRVTGYPHEFSGGMRQRVVIAMAIALSPKILIADEPTSALDVVVQRQILDLMIREIKQNNLSLIFVTHEIPLVKDLVQNVAVMYAGEVVEMGPTEKLLKEPLHPYSEMLVGSLLTLKSSREALKSASKETTESRRPVLGNACKFSNRCKYVFDRCRNERPVLRPVESERWVSCHKYN
jgi:peptide/nickel transport system ATP-binding protein